MSRKNEDLIGGNFNRESVIQAKAMHKHIEMCKKRGCNSDLHVKTGKFDEKLSKKCANDLGHEGMDLADMGIIAKCLLERQS